MNVNAALIVDVACAVVIAFFLFRGMFRGFSGEIVGLVGFFASLYCGWRFAQPFAKNITKYISALSSLDPTVLTLICGVSLFIAISLVFAMLNSLLSMLVQAANLSFVDHIFGIVIGVFKAAALILVVYVILITFNNLIPTDWMEQSFAMNIAKQVWPYVRDLLQEFNIVDFSALAGAVK